MDVMTNLLFETEIFLDVTYNFCILNNPENIQTVQKHINYKQNNNDVLLFLYVIKY